MRWMRRLILWRSITWWLFVGQTHRLSTLHTILSTGSPLKPQSFDYVYRDIKEDLLLGSITGQCNRLHHRSVQPAPSQVSTTGSITGQYNRLHHRSVQPAPSQVSATGSITGQYNRLHHRSVQPAPSQVRDTAGRTVNSSIELYPGCISMAADCDEMFFTAGGTDIIGCFAACCSDLPVHRGEIQCRVLGMAMESWDETGKTFTLSL